MTFRSPETHLTALAQMLRLKAIEESPPLIGSNLEKVYSSEKNACLMAHWPWLQMASYDHILVNGQVNIRCEITSKIYSIISLTEDHINHIYMYIVILADG